MVWPTGNHMIISDAFLDDHSAYKVVHEIGHVFDFKNSIDGIYYNEKQDIWASSRIKPSDTFVSAFSSDSGCSVASYLGCVNPDASVGFDDQRRLYASANKLAGTPNSYYSPSGKATKYGKAGSLDDFSESYAYMVYRMPV